MEICGTHLADATVEIVLTAAIARTDATNSELTAQMLTLSDLQNQMRQYWKDRAEGVGR